MKNQVEKAQTEKPNRLVLPLGQTIFLPQTAMGVSYIDKVRTKVYLDSVQRQTEAVCLRGYYEIDLEYHGLEGNRLYKHRVMLPLRAELPVDWLAPLEYEPDELHVVITKPMLRILSPYVLEFGAGLAVEYVGDRLYQETEKKDEKTAKEVEIIEMTSTETETAETVSAMEAETEVRERLASKFGTPDKPKPFIPVGKADNAGKADKADKKAKYHLPVWSGNKAESRPVVKAAEQAEASPAAIKTDSNAKAVPTAKSDSAAKLPGPAVEEVALPQINQGKLRSILTAAAISRLQAHGEVLSETGKNRAQEVIIMEPKMEAVEASVKMPISIQVAADDNAVSVASASEPASAETAAVEELQAVSASSEPAKSVEAVEGEAMATLAEQKEPVSETVASEAVVSESAASETVLSEPVVSEPAANEPAAPVMAETEPAAEMPVAKEAEDYAGELAAAVAAAAEAEASGVEAEAVSTIKPVDEVKATNENGVRLRVGLRNAQKVRPVPQTAKNDSQPASSGFCLKYYVVKSGDDPMSIALKHNVSLERLRESNKALGQQADLSVGMVLRIPC